ncbi:uncharacterized protein WM277_009267 isoform 1-T2 [Molossus nigricans]
MLTLMPTASPRGCAWHMPGADPGTLVITVALTHYPHQLGLLGFAEGNHPHSDSPLLPRPSRTPGYQAAVTEIPLSTLPGQDGLPVEEAGCRGRRRLQAGSPLWAGSPVTGATWGGPQRLGEARLLLDIKEPSANVGLPTPTPPQRNKTLQGQPWERAQRYLPCGQPAACSVPQGTPALWAAEGGAPLQSPWQPSVPFLLPVSPSPSLFPPPGLLPLPPGWALPVGTRSATADTCRHAARRCAAVSVPCARPGDSTAPAGRWRRRLCEGREGLQRESPHAGLLHPARRTCSQPGARGARPCWTSCLRHHVPEDGEEEPPRRRTQVTDKATEAQHTPRSEVP